MMQNNIQQPLFAPSGGAASQAADADFDLNEIFAEYFINEFDDPLNAYASSMANYSAGMPNISEVSIAGLTPAAAFAPSGATPNPMASYLGSTGGSGGIMGSGGGTATSATSASFTGLPTGGIKTAFHMGVKPLSRDSDSSETAAKKHKLDELPLPTPLAILQQQQQQQQQQQLQQLQHQAMLGAMHQQQQQQLQQQALATPSGGIEMNLPIGVGIRLGGVAGTVAGHPAAAAPPPVPQPAPATTATGVPLPVGVGIRLGGMGGVAPATATDSRLTNMVVPSSHPLAAMWGGAAAGAVGAHPGDVNMSEMAVEERRQRNREHAKRSRVRKKFMLESLQEEVRGLQKENQNLRMLVQEHIPELASQIISECCTSNPLFADPGTAEARELEKSDFNLMASLSSGQQCFVLSDPKLPDNPIVFASGGFYKLTGYSSNEVLGRNCRFLQGPGTDPRAVDVIRKAIATGSDSSVCLLNYKADRTPFWNNFFIAALRDSDNCIVNYVGVQCEVESEAGAAALEEKVNAILPLAPSKDEPHQGSGPAAGESVPPVAPAPSATASASTEMEMS